LVLWDSGASHRIEAPSGSAISQCRPKRPMIRAAADCAASPDGVRAHRKQGSSAKVSTST
jgi:hypothetical protein